MLFLTKIIPEASIANILISLTGDSSKNQVMSTILSYGNSEIAKESIDSAVDKHKKSVSLREDAKEETKVLSTQHENLSSDEEDSLRKQASQVTLALLENLRSEITSQHAIKESPDDQSIKSEKNEEGSHNKSELWTSKSKVGLSRREKNRIHAKNTRYRKKILQANICKIIENLETEVEDLAKLAIQK